MSFLVKGDYFETCSCDVSCPCIWLQPATRDACDLLLAAERLYDASASTHDISDKDA